MLSRLVAAAALAASLGLASPALAKEPVPAKTAASTKTAMPAKTPAPTAAPASRKANPNFERETAGASTPAKQRQKACGAEWRGFSATERMAQGPTWPQFYSKCVKRLKAANKA